MTEKTLEKAIEIKLIIDDLKRKKNELEEAKNLCFGNTSEVKNNDFYLNVLKKGCCANSMTISSKAANKALEYEILEVDEKLEKYLKDFCELN